jgi:hypothetical protein
VRGEIDRDIVFNGMAELRIPHHGDPDEPVFDVIDSLRHTLDGDDRAVAREVLIEARMEGQATIGEVLDRIESMEPSDRRALVERARERAGLESLWALEWEDDRRRRQAAAPPQRDAAGLAFQLCAAPDCSVEPLSDVTGAPMKVAAKRWWCPEHEHLAAPGDLNPWTSPLRMTARGIVDIEEEAAEAKRIETELESRRVRREQLQAERRAEAAERREYLRAREEQTRRETPPGMPV